MNESAVRQLAQSDRSQAVAGQWGEVAANVRKKVEELTRELRHLDLLTKALAEMGMKVDADLGPIGNAAAAARRDLERDTGRKPFTMPTATEGPRF